MAADERLDKVLIKYLNKLDKENMIDVSYDDPRYRNRRPDIFITGIHDLALPYGTVQENIIVEMKAPHVKLKLFNVATERL